MVAVHVRRAGLQDLPALWRCDDLAQSHAARRSLIESAVRGQQCLVAESAGGVVGFAILQHEFFGQGLISLVVVASAYRRRGIARTLLRAAERACRTAKLFTSTNASNHAAQELLRTAGFARSGVVENLDPGDPEYIYFKEVFRA